MKNETIMNENKIIDPRKDIGYIVLVILALIEFIIFILIINNYSDSNLDQIYQLVCVLLSVVIKNYCMFFFYTSEQRTQVFSHSMGNFFIV